MRRHLSTAALFVLIALAGLSGAARADIVVYDANAMYYANEQNPLTQTNSSFGPYTGGWGNTIIEDGPITGFTAFLPTEYGTNFAGNANTVGFATPNSVIVPAFITNVGTLPGSGYAGLNPGEILLHPGGRAFNGFDPPIFNGVLRFVVPTTGEYTVVGAFRSIASGSTVNEIGLNGSRIFVDTDPTNSPYGSTYAFDLSLNLLAGDIIDFAVNMSADDIGSDSTGLTAVITAVPEPSTWAMLTFGIIGLGSYTWRRRKAGAAPVGQAA